MPTSRVSNRVAWDHTVLSSRSNKLDWKSAPRPVDRPQQSGQPLGTLLSAWGLLAWSGVTAWGLWTRNDLDSHISMRLLMRGDFEEVAGVISGLVWAAVPAAAAFYLARRAREVTMDEIGGRTYWASLALMLLASMGVLRPTWDAAAGSRFARGGAGTPAAASAGSGVTPTSAEQADPAIEDQAIGEEAAQSVVAESVAAVPDSAAQPGAVMGTRNWARSRVAALRRAADESMGVAGAEADLAEPFFGPTAAAAGFPDER